MVLGADSDAVRLDGKEITMAKYDKPIGQSGIEWTNRTWNCITGCTKVSAGCKFCYAETLAERLGRMGNPRYVGSASLANPDRGDGPFAVRLHEDKLDEPLSWRDPEWVFVNSMSDLAHADVPLYFTVRMFQTMRLANWHRYQALTKRPERWGEITEAVVAQLGGFPRNVLPGTSVENKKALARLPLLREAGGRDNARITRMVSVEPLLESLCDGDVLALAQQLEEGGVGWVITGGEAGWHARPAVADWFREVRDACDLAGIPFFHKQFGGVGTTKEQKRGGTLATLDGVLHHAMPEVWHAPAPGKRASTPRQAALL